MCFNLSRHREKPLNIFPKSLVLNNFSRFVIGTSSPKQDDELGLSDDEPILRSNTDD